MLTILNTYPCKQPLQTTLCALGHKKEREKYFAFLLYLSVGIVYTYKTYYLFLFTYYFPKNSE